LALGRKGDTTKTWKDLHLKTIGLYRERINLEGGNMEERGLIPAGKRKTMTKVDIIGHIYEEVGFPKAEVARIVESVFDIIKETLQREDKVVVSGFGRFVTRNKKARRGRNPQTGSDMEIGPRRVLTFKASPVFAASLNKSKGMTL
jgi:integration host factor subunit alpha